MPSLRRALSRRFRWPSRGRCGWGAQQKAAGCPTPRATPATWGPPLEEKPPAVGELGPWKQDDDAAGATDSGPPTDAVPTRAPSLAGASSDSGAATDFVSTRAPSLAGEDSEEAADALEGPAALMVPAPSVEAATAMSPKLADSQGQALGDGCSSGQALGDGDSLELLMAPGDVLFFRGSGRLMEIGTASGLLGHVLLVLAAPERVARDSEEGSFLEAVWPSDEEVRELWKVATVESTRAEDGLHQTQILMYVEPLTSQLRLIGDMKEEDTVQLSEGAEALELWQSPAHFRATLRPDLMATVLAEMKRHEASWSGATAVRAALSSAHLAEGPDPGHTLEAVRASWTSDPICTSVIIVFWQRYLCELAAAAQREGAESPTGLSLILQWMPLKADRGLPGDLLGVLRSRGWACVSQVPRVFRPALALQQAAAPASRALSAALQAPPPPRPAAPTTPGSDFATGCCSDFATA